MATTTTTEVVQVQVLDATGRTKSFNIDNPTEDLSLTQIKSAFAPAINSGFWYNDTTDSPFMSIKAATLTTTTKVTLEDSTEITVTPNQFTFSEITTSQVEKIISIDGGQVTNASFIWLDSVNINNVWYAISFTNDAVTVQLKALSNTINETTGYTFANVIISIGNTTITVPFKGA